MPGFGTLLNVITVITGSIIGLVFRNRLQKKYTKIVFQVLGLFTVFLGIKMALDGTRLLVLVFSLVLGAITGEALNIENSVESFGTKLKNKFNFKDEKFTEGLTTSFLMFCMGSMTFLGAIQEGMTNDATLLSTKAVMDGFSSIALAAGLGIGVLFSSVPLLLYQGGLTLLAFWLGDFIPPYYINEISATGGILLIGLGFNILEIRKIKVLNILPALLFVPLILWIASFFT